MGGFFAGRYGVDKLNRTLFWGSVILSIAGAAIAIIFGSGADIAVRIVQGIGLVMLVLALLRAMSRNFAKRQAENAAYLRAESRITGIFNRAKGKGQSFKEARAERKNYKHLTCPQCMQKLRVPRGKGKIRVTCTKCRCRFEAKT